jgi:pimeloyl-ACP methyl ester carboxylesterase
MPPVRTWQLAVDGITIAGTDQGPGHAPAIVLLHGLASTCRWWDLVAAHLALQHRVVRFDHRGHGRSTIPASGYTVDGLATDAIQVIDGLGLTQVVLAGHSLGATVALIMATARPELVVAVGCVEGGLYDPKLMFGCTWAQAQPAMLHARRGRITQPVLQAWLAAAGLPAHLLPIVVANYTDDHCGDLRLRLDPKHETELAHSLWTRGPAPLLTATQAPILMVAAHHGHPHHDRPRHESLRHAHQLLGHRLRTLWLSGGHDLPLQQPAAIAAALADLAVLSLV